MRQFIEYYTDPHFESPVIKAISANWKTITFSIALSIATLTGEPFWFPDAFSTIKIPLWIIITITPFIVMIGFWIHAKNYVKKGKSSVQLTKLLHDTSHSVRDVHSRSMIDIAAGKKIEDEENFYQMCDLFCSKVKDTFNELKNDTTIGAAIRIAKSDDKGKISYTTVGRSGLNDQRKKTSQDIPEDKGIPNYFKTRSWVGALIYNDINEAIKQGSFHGTENETKYSEDVKSFIVLPLNGYDGTSRNMVGLLYITSPNDCNFHPNDIGYSKVIADQIAIAICQKVVELKKSLKDFNEIRR